MMISRKLSQIKESARKTTTAILDSLDAENPNIMQSTLTGAISGGVTSIMGERPKGWKLVQKNLGRVLEYGRAEGILQPLDASMSSAKEGGGLLTGIIQQAQEEVAAEKAKQKDDKVNLPTNDISTIHEAIPFLPVPIAVICFLANLLAPGSGTLLSGVFGMCFGQPRINLKEGRRLATLLINTAVGISQFMTVTFFLVGWFWSIAWGGLLVIHSKQYRDALLQRRQEAVATAAIEALTKDSILHRRDVKTLVKAHKSQEKKKRSFFKL